MISFLVVLYKRTIDQSETLKGICSSEIFNSLGFRLIVWDNSPEALSSDDLQELKRRVNRIEYFHDEQNRALSKVYNNVIDQVRQEGLSRYLVLLDHDTNINDLYLTELKNCSLDDHSLILPTVMTDGRVRSPLPASFIQRRLRSHSIQGSVRSKGMMAINSGMCISLDYLKKSGFRYNEALSNYGTDNQFMIEYAKNENSFFLMNYCIDHSLSFFDHPDLGRRIEIFREIKKATRLLYPALTTKRIGLELSFLLSGIKYALRYRNRGFLRQ